MRKHVCYYSSRAVLVPAGMAQTQQSSTETGRKLIRKVDPSYPEMARRVNLRYRQGVRRSGAGRKREVGRTGGRQPVAGSGRSKCHQPMEIRPGEH